MMQYRFIQRIKKYQLYEWKSFQNGGHLPGTAYVVNEQIIPIPVLLLISQFLFFQNKNAKPQAIECHLPFDYFQATQPQFLVKRVKNRLMNEPIVFCHRL